MLRISYSPEAGLYCIYILRPIAEKTTIKSRTEYDYFANARKRLTWLVRSWQNSKDYPLDLKTKERFKSNVQMVEGMIDESSTETKKLLISKAYRTVKGSFRHMFYTTEKLEGNGGSGQ